MEAEKTPKGIEIVITISEGVPTTKESDELATRIEQILGSNKGDIKVDPVIEALGKVIEEGTATGAVTPNDVKIIEEIGKILEKR